MVGMEPLLMSQQCTAMLLRKWVYFIEDVSLFNLLFVIIVAANSNVKESEGEELVGSQRTTDFLKDSGLEEEKCKLEQKIIMARLNCRSLLADWGYSIPNQRCGPNGLHDVQLSSSNSLPTVYVRSPSSNSEMKRKSRSELKCKDNIVIPCSMSPSWTIPTFLGGKDWLVSVKS